MEIDNLINILGKIFLSVGVATVCSFCLSTLVLCFLKILVYFFNLNEEKDAYWVLSVSFRLLFFSWLMFFIIFYTFLLYN
jgi:hypothetical protein